MRVRSAVSGVALALVFSVSALAASHNNLDRFVGQYRYVDEPDIVLSVFHTGDHLTIETARTAATELKSEGATDSEAKFKASGHGPEFVFTINAAGDVTEVRREEQGGAAYATKISTAPEHNHFRHYSREEVMIPMRDGVKLHAIILRPTDTKEPLPFLMQRRRMAWTGQIRTRSTRSTRSWRGAATSL